MNDYSWQGALMAIQACIGAGVGVAVRSLRGIHADVERISEHLRVMNGRLGKLEQRVEDHEGHCSELHDRHKTDVLSIRDRLDRVFGGHAK